MKIVGDTHTHTVACGHAVGTLTENILHARALGHRFMATTEHCCDIPGAPIIWFFNNLIWHMPREIEGMVLLRGAEANVVDINATVDLPEYYLKELDLIIGSVHHECFHHGDYSSEDYTRMYEKLAENPYIDIIGHCGDPRFSYDYDRAAKAFAAHDKIVEVNDSSPRSRKGSDKTCREILKCCKKHGVKLVLASDAHCPQRVGGVDGSIRMVEELSYPEELILNIDYKRFQAEMKHRRGIDLPD